MDRKKEGEDEIDTQEAGTSQDKPTLPVTPRRLQEADAKRRMAAFLKDAREAAAAAASSNPDTVSAVSAVSAVSEATGQDSDKGKRQSKDKTKATVIEPVPGTARYPKVNPKIGPNLEKTDRAEQARVRKYAVEMSDHVQAMSAGMVPTMLITGVPHFRGFLGCYCVHHRNDGQEIAAAFGCGAVKIMTDNGWVKRTLKAGSPFVLNPMMTVRYHPKMNNILFAGGAEGRIYAFNTETVGPRELFCYQQGNSVNSLDISTDGTTLVTAGNDTAVRVYDPDTKQLKATYISNPALRSDEHNHLSRVFAVRRHPLSPSVFVTGGWDNRVMVWDVRVQNGYVTKFIGAHVCGEGVDIHDNLVMTASWMRDRALRFWDLTSGRAWDPTPISERPYGHNRGDYLYCCQYFAGDPTGSLVLTGGSGVRGAMLVDRSNCKCQGIIPLKDSLLALDTYNNRIVAGGVQHSLKIGELRYYTQPPPEINLTEQPSDDDYDEEEEH